jgi:nucleoside-diphosphate-sugar epimerase
MKRALVTGAAGFIGGHLCRFLKEKGYWVRAVDYVEPRYGDVECDEGLWHLDLRSPYAAIEAFRGGFYEVYCLAADMGGMGFIGKGGHTPMRIMANNAQININCAKSAIDMGGHSRLLYTSLALLNRRRMC